MKHTKSSIKIVLISLFLAINFVVIYFLAQAYGFFNTGAERSTILNLTSLETTVYQPKLTWQNIENPSRPLDKSAKNTVEIDYLNAWHARQLALYSNDIEFLEDHYTDQELEKLKQILNLNASQNIQIESTTLAHDLDLDFYSADGQMLALTDHNVEEVQYVYQDEILQATSKERSTYEVIMLLKDGRWRVRHIVKLDPDKQDSLSKPKFDSLLKSQLRGINYYPKDAPWDTFGEKFNVDMLNKDLKIIKDLDLNTIRVFVGYEDFGKEYVLPEKLEKIEKLLDSAHQNDLKVIVTLFDFYGNYSIFDWPAAQKHARAIVSRFKDHPAILAWDIKNEPDLDFASRGKERVLGWLQTMINTVRSEDSDALITIGWSSPEAALELQEEVDLISFHYYKEAEGFQEAFATLRSKTEKPLMLQEFGLSTYRGFWRPFGESQTDQKEYYETMLQTIDKEKLHFAFWTLYDFTEVPSQVVGKLPWRKKPQAAFGIIDKEGNTKESYPVFRQ